jgi:3-keto-disaccharide hydrolase
VSVIIDRLVTLGALGCALSASGCSSAPQSAAVTAVAEPSSWQNLLPPADLRGFTRVPIDPGASVADRPVWQPRPDGSLFIDGAGAKEMLLDEREIGDGFLHVEWRFLASEAAAGASPSPAAGAPGVTAPVYNGGVYVRTALDGRSWVQLQVSHAEKPPVVGDLIAQVPGRAERVDVFQAQPSAAAPIGEWNTYDIRMQGPSIDLGVNGKPAAAWDACPLLTGHVGLQAEGSPIEVRAFRYRPL